MRARICDRCMKYMSEKDDTTEIAIWYNNGLQKMDLCPNCIKELKEWIKAKLKQKDKENGGDGDG